MTSFPTFSTFFKGQAPKIISKNRESRENLWKICGTSKIISGIQGKPVSGSNPVQSCNALRRIARRFENEDVSFLFFLIHFTSVDCCSKSGMKSDMPERSFRESLAHIKSFYPAYSHVLSLILYLYMYTEFGSLTMLHLSPDEHPGRVRHWCN